MRKKYRLTNKTCRYKEKILYRIQALYSFDSVKEGDYGGFVENDTNLSQQGTCWIADNAIVCDEAWVHGNAQIYDHARVTEQAEVYGESVVCNHAHIFGKARITQCACVQNHGKVGEEAVISDFACIKDYAEVGEKAWVYQQAVVGGFEKISGNDRIISNSLDKKRFQRKLQFFS